MYDILKPELDIDPKGLGYSTMTDQEAADAMNARTQVVDDATSTLTAEMLLSCLDYAQYSALPASDRQLFVGILDACPLTIRPDPSKPGIMPIITEIFPLTTATRVALKNAIKGTISRAAELGLPRIQEAHIQSARAMP